VNRVPLLLELAIALLAVDFVSGLVHWAEDTFATVETPIVGAWIVAPNVIHHRDGGAFVSKSWLASSWDLCLAALLVTVAAVLTGHFGPGVALAAVAGANANQIHKWCHARGRAPALVRWLWALGLMQRPEHHAQHHVGEKNTHYCVITPFVNPLLDRLHFWRLLERVLVPIFGAPRRVDLAALPQPRWAVRYVRVEARRDARRRR
jgi:ubiquitin-conjugating enzyme E2 variant